MSGAGEMTDSSGRTIVVDPNPMNEIMKRAEQLRSETSDGIIYPCEYCQKVFKFKYEYERHAKIHSGDRPWQCPECMKTFSRKDNMRAHMKIHTGELVRHVCQLCGKSYGRKYDLQVHERVHTGERPFECGSCGKSFISTSRLRAHQLIHCKNIYLPRHVRNKKLHLLKGPDGRLLQDSDSPTDSMDGCSPVGQDLDDEDMQDQAIVSATAARPRPSLAIPRRSQPHQQRQQPPLQPQQQQRASINLTINPARHISISVVKSCSRSCPTIRLSRDSSCDSAEKDDYDEPDGGEDSLDARSSVDVAARMRQLEDALAQRKAELEERGIKVEVDGLLTDINADLQHEDFHVVLPTEACKDEPCCE